MYNISSIEMDLRIKTNWVQSCIEVHLNDKIKSNQIKSNQIKSDDSTNSQNTRSNKIFESIKISYQVGSFGRCNIFAICKYTARSIEIVPRGGLPL